jgi:hypothetical protein
MFGRAAQKEPGIGCYPLVPPNVPTITGANSHPNVTCVAGVDTKQHWVGYSSWGPGAPPVPGGGVNEKPNIAAYTHFLGSEALGKGKPDSGTSAACPVMAGVMAAVRSIYPFDRNNPKRTSQTLSSTFC